MTITFDQPVITPYGRGHVVASMADLIETLYLVSYKPKDLDAETLTLLNWRGGPCVFGVVKVDEIQETT